MVVLVYPRLKSGIEYKFQPDKIGVNDHLSLILEIRGDLAADVRLYLAHAPGGFAGMAHEHARLEERRKIAHSIIARKAVTMSASRDIHALLGSRICHDLISPLGAIGNGVELLAMSPGGTSPEVALIAESVENANARIRYFRVAFGSAGAEATMGRPEIVEILTDLTKGSRIGIEWAAAGSMPRSEVKLAFLLILCLESAMPWGGEVSVNTTEGRWLIGARAEKFKIAPELWELLVNPSIAVDLTAAQVQFALVPETARTLRRSVTTELQDSFIKISF